MLHDVVHPSDQPLLEQVSSPLSAQILEFCDSELFQETIQNSDVTSVSNCCYEEQSSYSKSQSFPPDMIKYPMSTTTIATTTENGNDSFNGMFEEKLVESDISASIDFTNLHQYSFSHQDQFDLSLLQNQISLTTNGPIPPYAYRNEQTNVVSAMMGPMGCESECLSIPPSKCMSLNNHLLDHPYLPSRNLNPILPVESCGIYNGNLSIENEILQARELDFHGNNEVNFYPDPLPHPYTSNELQALSNENQHLINNGGQRYNPQLANPEIPCLESESLRGANKLTSEERKEKIHRYMKKRNERNFSKKIKYACRKTLADSRPRVRGRFAKNDEFGDHNRNICNTHEEDTDEDAKSMHAMVKDEEKLDSMDIFAQISSLNSFRCNYPIQSWI